MKKVCNTFDMVYEPPLLVEGNSEEEKFLFAGALHYKGNRRNKMFIAFCCSDANKRYPINYTLFGKERCNSSGVKYVQRGLLEMADGGTLFLGHIDKCKIDFQERFLQMLKVGVFNRVNGEDQIRVDVQIVVSTSNELRKQVEKGLFQEELFSLIRPIRISTCSPAVYSRIN